jgi:hypothetical protein
LSIPTQDKETDILFLIWYSPYVIWIRLILLIIIFVAFFNFVHKYGSLIDELKEMNKSEDEEKNEII